jgi:hypothetical protein
MQPARRRVASILGCVEGGSGEPGRDGDGILGALREAVGSLGETTAGSWVRGESGRDDGGILAASREAVGSRGEMVVGDAGEKQI